MGQAAAKPAGPKPAGIYHAITGRRCGRRHACVGFTPLSNSQDGDAHKPNEDCKQLDLENVQEESSLSFSESSRPLAQVPPALLDKPLSENAGTRELICQNVSSQTSEANTPLFSVVCTGPEGNQISQNFMNPDENSEDFAENTSGRHSNLNGKNGIAFVNIDSYEPDSSDGEEDDVQDKCSLVKEAACLVQGRLDNILSQCEKDVECLRDLQSQLSSLNHGVSRENCEGAGPMPLACPNNRTLISTEDQAIPKSNLSGTSCETQQINHILDVGIGTPVADVLNVSDGKADQEKSSEPVVRPKIRTRNTANQFEREKQLPNDEEEKPLSSSWKRIGVADCQQCHPECPLRDSEEISSGVFFLSRVYSDQKNTERDLGKNAAAQNQKNVPHDSSFWDEFENCNRYFLMSHEDEDSSECSDGEWATAVPSCLTAAEQEQSSSEESWDTLPGGEECEVQNISCDVKEENTNCGLQEGEEGEILWLPYREEVESSSDEENDPVNDFMHPAFFLFNGNNSFEDDSSVSEDLDVEWRTLDEFEVLGLTLNIPYMDPQLLTFVALEGRLEAVEAALAQLESLAFDVEQTRPPATKETIDCLPVVLITGQDESCTICCSEYVRGEYVAELPCHHLFHKSCVTPWLQRSGTCPVCRHVLAPVLPEAADDTYR
ncbi:E3 ubiquitin-protein ligase Praja-2 isoform X1 [Chiroxiphia lanceolata]|uniref:E3 ubiquitin-protein ligase Praja-2 isoform X1 n=1 Tax=Chiroxiphia lanceolata TaxID=296741 RepID=UPI0013CEC551|nr:E3 ubiquitin-protein ligase Praja-2 isoform X1 [Chiroxiphia lanceolata]XP_032531602.1 E3 ubiquitin-protein ligase Praja-2 isoform X1 [Chiroxiphia lanceolata]XP_032531603.1 E3 ubiquitin-protein ligase Praja-2 isoform X1 [Chiroxiphia lanceolata]XP_032531604.1 E3 ubiquitin-protein ligase Praja-2 isoform X1 [Chiroxiphia lanceolata]XP_032531605.1 E3 ubiquitin-protein ligase Praja-2 isoform X1 [Chiroxiphia lanceolata]